MVCRPKRSAKRGWTRQAILRVVTQHLEDGGDKDLLCEELREVLVCKKCDCGRLPELVEQAAAILDRILTPEVEDALVDFQDLLDDLDLPASAGPVDLDAVEEAAEAAGGIRKWFSSLFGD